MPTEPRIRRHAENAELARQSFDLLPLRLEIESRTPFFDVLGV